MYPYIRKQLTLLMYLSCNSNNIYNICNVRFGRLRVICDSFHIIYN